MADHEVIPEDSFDDYIMILVSYLLQIWGQKEKDAVTPHKENLSPSDNLVNQSIVKNGIMARENFATNRCLL